MSDLYVLVTLLETDGVFAAIDYEGTAYFVNLEDMEHISNNRYAIATYALRVPIVRSFNG